MRPVQSTSELQRILEMPRRPANGGPELPELTRLLSEALRTSTGTMTLRPIQAFALAELYENGGLFGPIGVGQGKALLSLLAPVVAQAYKPILFVPAALREQTIRQVIPQMRPHWRLHRNLRIESYNFLSSPNSSTFLDEYEPDMILLDEAHALKRADSARTKRFLRFMKAHPKTKLVALSGTMTTKSLMDFWELIKLALPGFKCPLPLHWTIVREWDAALGAGQSWAYSEPMDEGALKKFCAPGENARQGFRRRLTETPGVVGTSESAIGTSLVMTARGVKVPAEIEKALTDLRKNMSTPWGEEIEDGIALARHARQLACGFYYRWRWPNDKPDQEWLFARADWHRELRYHLKRSVPGMDSPFLVGAAIARGDLESEFYAPWCAVRDRYRPHPPVEAVWISDFLIADILRWLSEGEGIAWIEHTAVATRLAQLGARVYGSGPQDARAILEARGPIVASIAAHGTGKNLQRFSRNLVVSCPSSGATWQQLLGRTHRLGQEADEITADVYQHTDELTAAWGKALETAIYLEHTTGDKQKLLFASRVGFDVTLNATAVKNSVDTDMTRVRLTG
jgi:hypothetical protein